MFVDMFLLGLAAGFLGYVVTRISYELWRMGVQVPSVNW